MLPFSSINFTPDVTIIVVIFALVIYGLLLGRNKIKTLAMSVYVGYVIATELGLRLSEALSSRHLDLGGKLSPNVVVIGLFIAPLVILEFGRREHHGRGSRHGGMLMTMVLCVLTAALVISCGLKLISGDLQQHILADSNLAVAIYGLRLWWIGLVPLAVIGENFIPQKEH